MNKNLGDDSVKTCKKCGVKTQKTDNCGFCVNCSENFTFKHNISFITDTEAKRNRPPKEYLESEDFKSGMIDPIFTGFGSMIMYLVYAFNFAKEDFGELAFIGAFLTPFFNALIVGALVMISHILIGVATKKIWIILANRLPTMHLLKIISALCFLAIPLLLSLIIAIKSVI